MVETDIEAELVGDDSGTLSGPPAMPTTRQPFSFAIWPTTAPTAPLAAATTRVSPGLGWPMLSRPV